MMLFEKSAAALRGLSDTDEDDSQNLVAKCEMAVEWVRRTTEEIGDASSVLLWKTEVQDAKEAVLLGLVLEKVDLEQVMMFLVRFDGREELQGIEKRFYEAVDKLETKVGLVERLCELVESEDVIKGRVFQVLGKLFKYLDQEAVRALSGTLGELVVKYSDSQVLLVQALPRISQAIKDDDEFLHRIASFDESSLSKLVLLLKIDDRKKLIPIVKNPKFQELVVSLLLQDSNDKEALFLLEKSSQILGESMDYTTLLTELREMDLTKLEKSWAKYAKKVTTDSILFYKAFNHPNPYFARHTVRAFFQDKLYVNREFDEMFLEWIFQKERLDVEIDLTDAFSLWFSSGNNTKAFVRIVIQGLSLFLDQETLILGEYLWQALAKCDTTFPVDDDLLHRFAQVLTHLSIQFQTDYMVQYAMEKSIVESVVECLCKGSITFSNPRPLLECELIQKYPQSCRKWLSSSADSFQHIDPLTWSFLSNRKLLEQTFQDDQALEYLKYVEVQGTEARQVIRDKFFKTRLLFQALESKHDIHEATLTYLSTEPALLKDVLSHMPPKKETKHIDDKTVRRNFDDDKRAWIEAFVEMDPQVSSLSGSEWVSEMMRLLTYHDDDESMVCHGEMKIDEYIRLGTLQLLDSKVMTDKCEWAYDLLESLVELARTTKDISESLQTTIWTCICVLLRKEWVDEEKVAKIWDLIDSRVVFEAFKFTTFARWFLEYGFIAFAFNHGDFVIPKLVASFETDEFMPVEKAMSFCFVLGVVGRVIHERQDDPDLVKRIANVTTSYIGGTSVQAREVSQWACYQFLANVERNDDLESVFRFLEQHRQIIRSRQRYDERYMQYQVDVVEFALRNYPFKVRRIMFPWLKRLGNGKMRQLTPEMEPFQRGVKYPAIILANLLFKKTNLAGLMRTLDFFSLERLVIQPVSLENDRHFKGIVSSCNKWITPQKLAISDITSFMRELKQQGYFIVALEQTANSAKLHTYDGWPSNGKVLFLLGMEKQGIPAHLLKFVDQTIEIEQLGLTRSLNVHVSCTILLWEYFNKSSSQLNNIS